MEEQTTVRIVVNHHRLINGFRALLIREQSFPRTRKHRLFSSMAWKWKKVGVLVPEHEWNAFDALVARLYGPQNKGKRKYLYTVAFQQLMKMKEASLKLEVHRAEGIELGILPPDAPTLSGSSN